MRVGVGIGITFTRLGGASPLHVDRADISVDRSDITVDMTEA
jgi:hypothetical protein